MSQSPATTEPNNDPVIALEEKTEALQRRLAEVLQQADARLIRAELKAEALRAGIVDIDGLKLIDTTDLKLSATGDVEGAAELVAQLKRAKPWLFGSGFSSSGASVPQAQPPRQKLATEMTDDEYRSARAAMLRQRP